MIYTGTINVAMGPIAELGKRQRSWIGMEQTMIGRRGRHRLCWLYPLDLCKIIENIRTKKQTSVIVQGREVY